jgi:acyl-coenzyme A thioesterase PaaI-like protein
MSLKKLDVFKIANKIKYPKVRTAFLDNALKIGIPFNMGMGMKIKLITERESQIESLPVYRRRNHVGTAHAISQALLIEYTAGLLIAQKYGFDDYRLILTNINITYHKPGKGTLTGTALAPDQWPNLKEGEMFLDMFTKVHNEKNELISEGKTTWQIKSWSKMKKQH